MNLYTIKIEASVEEYFFNGLGNIYKNGSLFF